MRWNYSIHADDLDSPTDIRGSAQAPPPTSFWAIGPVPEKGVSGWMIGLRFVIQDGHPVLAEQRAFPDEGISPERARGEWSGDPYSVPEFGLPASVVKNLALHRMEDQVRAAVSNYKDPTWGTDEHQLPPDGEPPDNWLEWSELTETVGVETNDTASRRKRGRPQLPDEYLARVAYYYMEARDKNVKVHRYITTKMRTPDKTPNPAFLIKRARERDFLTPTTKIGRLGGDMTPKARAVLERSGFLAQQHEGDES